MRQHRTLLPAATLLLAACDDGRLDLSISDAPVDDATAVQIEFAGVDLFLRDGSTEEIDFDPPLRFDLLALQGGELGELINNRAVPEGQYDGLRLRINASGSGSDSFIDLSADGGRVPIILPEGNEDLLEIDESFEVTEGETTRLLVDFDLRSSLLPPEDAGGDYELRPALRMLADGSDGAVAGTVADALVPVGCAPAVYAFRGTAATLDDVGGADEPFASALLSRGAASGDLEYRIALLPAGNYTLAFTCEADQDDPREDDDIAFGPDDEASVTADRTATVNF